MLRMWYVAALVALAAPLAGCGDEPVAGLVVTPAIASTPAGTRVHFAALSTSDGRRGGVATDVAWSSSAPDVATVDASGQAIALKPGIATVLATAAGVTATATVTVTDAALKVLMVTPAAPAIAAGSTQQMIATGVYSNDQTVDLSSSVVWSTADPNVAKVSNEPGQKGLTTGVGSGTTDVSAQSGAIVGSTTLSVTSATLVSIALAPTTPSLAAGTSRQLTATGTYSDGTTQDLTTQAAWTSSDDAVADVDDVAMKGLVAALHQGAATITAEVSGVTGATTVIVSQADLVSVAITPVNPQVPIGATVQLKATGTFSDMTTQDLTANASWTCSDAKVATVGDGSLDKGVLAGLQTGIITVNATHAGVTGSTLVAVTAASLAAIVVSPTDAVVAKGSKQMFTATGIYSDNSSQDVTSTVTWSSSTDTVASISNVQGTKGQAVALSAGKSQITATQGTVSGSTSLTVTTATLVSISVTPANPTLAKGTTLGFQATGVYSDNSTQNITNAVTWASSNPGAATISNASGSAGLATAIATGSTTISAQQGTLIGTTDLTVTTATLVAVTVTPTMPTIAKGTSLPMQATGAYSDGTTQDLTSAATWTSSDPSVASVSNAFGSKGLLTGATGGATTITASVGATTGSTTIAVSAAVLKSISISPTAPTLAKGTTLQLSAIGTFSDMSTQDLTSMLTWSTTDGAVATVSNAAGTRGLAKAVGKGVAKVSAAAGSITGSTTVSVTSETLIALTITPPNPSLSKGLTTHLHATGTYTDMSTQDLTTQVTWSTKNPAVATISNAGGSEGLAAAVSVGQTVATVALGTVSASTSITVSTSTLESIVVTPTNPSIAKGTSVQLVATGIYSDNSSHDITQQATWASANTQVAMVSNAGLRGRATGIGVGAAMVTATLGGVTGSTVLTVSTAILKSIAVAPSNPVVAKGTSVQLTATGTFSDGSTQVLTQQVAWTSSSAQVATVVSSMGQVGLATGIGVGVATVTAAKGNVSGSTKIFVTAATLKAVTVTPANAKVAQGFTVHFTAVGTFSDGSMQDISNQVAWATTDGAVASISNQQGTRGTAYGVSPGQVVVTATSKQITGKASLKVTSASLKSIEVSPQSAVLKVGATLAYTAVGMFSDGSTQNITAQVAWSSAKPAVAQIAQQGLARGLSPGSATIRAQAASVKGDTGLTVF